MNTLNSLDANVWLALMWSRHAHSEKARLWFERAGEEIPFLPFHTDHRSEAPND